MITKILSYEKIKGDSIYGVTYLPDDILQFGRMQMKRLQDRSLWWGDDGESYHHVQGSKFNVQSNLNFEI